MSVFVSTLTTKGQTTVPEPVRRALGLAAGRRLVWELRSTTEGGEPQLLVRSGRPLSALAGSLASIVAFPGLEEEKAAVEALRTAHTARKHRLK